MRSVLLIAAASLTSVCSAVIVDRVAITVGTKVITQSEIEDRIRLTAFQNGEKADFSMAARREAAQRLIDQKLVEREMEVGRYPHLAPRVRESLVAEYETAHYKSNPAGMAAALREYGLTPQDLEDELALQTELLTFLNLRFRPAVQVTEQDIRKYFDEHVPDADLNDVRGEIEDKLTNERATRELNVWLQDQRRRTKIVYAEKELEDGK